MRKPIQLKNKKGEGGGIFIIMFFVILFIVLFAGVSLAILAAMTNWAFDELTPIYSSIGMAGDVNVSQASEHTIVPLNTFVQNLTWMTGFIYALFLVGLIVFVAVMKVNPNKWLMAFFFVCMIMFIIVSILVSNIYENIYTGTDEMATRLQEQGLISWLILYSPMVFTIIMFIAGIVMFSGINQEQSV